MVVELMDTNKSVRDISEELGVKKDLLYQWRRELIRKGEAGFFKSLITIDGGSTEIILSESGDMACDIGWNRTVYKGQDGPY